MIQYKKGFKYQLTKTYRCIIDIYPDTDIETDYILLCRKGILSIKRGYAWDGPSGPTIDTKTFMRGSLVHDALYQLLRMKLLDQSLRLKADDILYRICREDGMAWFRAWYVRRELRKFGAPAASPKNRKKVYTAP